MQIREIQLVTKFLIRYETLHKMCTFQEYFLHIFSSLESHVIYSSFFLFLILRRGIFTCPHEHAHNHAKNEANERTQA